MENEEGGTDNQSSHSEKNAESQERTYTKEEVEKKLRGPGNALKKAQARVAELESAEQEREKKAQEKKGEWKELATGYKGEIEGYKAKIKGYEDRETARLEKVNTEAETQFNNLPEGMQELVSKELGPDERLRIIQKLASKIEDRTFEVRASGGGRGGRISEEEDEEKRIKSLETKFFGGGKK
jgi:hypothetical protein